MAKVFLSGHWKLVITAIITLSLAAIPAIQGYAVLKTKVGGQEKYLTEHIKESNGRHLVVEAEIDDLEESMVRVETKQEVILVTQQAMKGDLKDMRKEQNESANEIKDLIRAK